MRHSLPIVLFSLLLGACSKPAPPAPVRILRELEAPVGRTLSAERGEAVFRVRQKSDRVDPGAPPGAPKVDRGFLEVRYEGLLEDGRLAFAVKQVDVEWSDDPAPMPASPALAVDPRSREEVRFGDVVVDVLEATPERLTYRLRRAN